MLGRMRLPLRAMVGQVRPQVEQRHIAARDLSPKRSDLKDAPPIAPVQTSSISRNGQSDNVGAPPW